MQKIIKRTVKDSIFTDLFNDTHNILDLYKTLHPEDTQVTEDDIGIVTIKNVIANGIYNDLGFSIGKRHIVLAECQSLWSVNIAYRVLEYFADTMHDYRKAENLDVYSPKPIILPKPEFYMIYVGRDRPDMKPYISLREDIYCDETVPIDIVVKVISEGDRNTLLGQYITFCHVLDEQMNNIRNRRDAIKSTIDICRNDNILREYLIEHEREVEDMLADLYDQDLIIETYGYNERKEGREEGLELGAAIGIIETTLEFGMTLEQAMLKASEKCNFSMERVKTIWEEHSKGIILKNM